MNCEGSLSSYNLTHDRFTHAQTLVDISSFMASVVQYLRYMGEDMFSGTASALNTEGPTGSTPSVADDMKHPYGLRPWKIVVGHST